MKYTSKQDMYVYVSSEYQLTKRKAGKNVAKRGRVWIDDGVHTFK